MLIEFLAHAVSLDIGWIIQLVFSNLHYVFAFIALMYIVGEGKGYVLGFFLVTFVTWVTKDFAAMIGWAMFTGSFLSFLYITRIALLTFISKIKFLEKRMFLVMTVQFFVAWIIFNVFMV